MSNEHQKVNIIGVYHVEENKDVHLIELLIQEKPSNIEVVEFTQEDPGQPKDNWQVAWDEYYLNYTGDEIIGDYFKKPEHDLPPTRMTFFLYFIDFTRTLVTPFGNIQLSKPMALPERLKRIIRFEEP